LRIPLLGVLIYGIAEASTAYLVTKITDPPPKPADSEGFAASQQEWRNKHEFLNAKIFSLGTDIAPHTTPPTTQSSSTVGTSTGIPDEPPPPYTEMRSR